MMLDTNNRPRPSIRLPNRQELLSLRPSFLRILQPLWSRSPLTAFAFPDNKMGKSRHSSERRHREDDGDRHRRDRKSRRDNDGKDEDDVTGSKRRKNRSSADSEDDSSRRRTQKHRQKSLSEEERRSKKKHSRRDGNASEDDDDSRRDRKRHSHDKEDGERRKRKHRKEDYSSDEEDDRRKDKKRQKDDRKKKKKSSKKEDRKAKEVDKSSLLPLGENVGAPPITLLDPEKDYFTYHQHLWVFLFREEGAAFNDLTSDQCHTAFGRFSERYNVGHLEAAYYDPKGLPQEVLEECKTTRHSWSFQTSETERKGLELLQKGVRRQTEYEAPQGDSKNEPFTKADVGNAVVNGRDKAVIIAPRLQTPEERLADRQTNKRLRGQVRTAEEELNGGRKDGRERQIEKRKEEASRIHAAAKDREEARAGGVELTDAAIYGGDGSNFQSALSRERQRKTQRGDKQKSRLEELQKKEQERQENMLKTLGLTGLKPGQKITIAPRKDA
jgi:hypothetical protein